MATRVYLGITVHRNVPNTYPRKRLKLMNHAIKMHVLKTKINFRPLVRDEFITIFFFLIIKHKNISRAISVFIFKQCNCIPRHTKRNILDTTSFRLTPDLLLLSPLPFRPFFFSQTHNDKGTQVDTKSHT